MDNELFPRWMVQKLAKTTLNLFHSLSCARQFPDLRVTAWLRHRVPIPRPGPTRNPEPEVARSAAVRCYSPCDANCLKSVSCSGVRALGKWTMSFT
jgi:hypothetical protein